MQRNCYVYSLDIFIEKKNIVCIKTLVKIFSQQEDRISINIHQGVNQIFKAFFISYLVGTDEFYQTFLKHKLKWLFLSFWIFSSTYLSSIWSKLYKFYEHIMLYFWCFALAGFERIRRFHDLFVKFERKKPITII